MVTNMRPQPMRPQPMQLQRHDLSMSDFPSHDMAAEFVLLAEQRQVEHDLKEQFEV